MNWNPENILKNVLNKMIRSSALTYERALLIWKMELYQSKSKRAELNRAKLLT